MASLSPSPHLVAALAELGSFNCHFARMNDSDRIRAVIDQFLNLRRESCRTLARLKALEAVVAQLIPSAERAAWYERVDRQYERCLQSLLEEFEKQSPGFAALFDDRSPEELRGLE